MPTTTKTFTSSEMLVFLNTISFSNAKPNVTIGKKNNTFQNVYLLIRPLNENRVCISVVLLANIFESPEKGKRLKQFSYVGTVCHDKRLGINKIWNLSIGY